VARRAELETALRLRALVERQPGNGHGGRPRASGERGDPL
jgi:hypothetical protein